MKTKIAWDKVSRLGASRRGVFDLGVQRASEGRRSATLYILYYMSQTALNRKPGASGAMASQPGDRDAGKKCSLLALRDAEVAKLVACQHTQSVP